MKILVISHCIPHLMKHNNYMGNIEYTVMKSNRHDVPTLIMLYVVQNWERLFIGTHIDAKGITPEKLSRVLKIAQFKYNRKVLK